MIDRIEIFITALSQRLQRIFSSGAYDTGPADSLLGKHVLVKIHADGVTGIAQVRRWLAHWDDVLAYSEAPQHAGGGGAVLVLLKGPK